jgi:hypothetical protein
VREPVPSSVPTPDASHSTPDMKLASPPTSHTGRDALHDRASRFCASDAYSWKSCNETAKQRSWSNSFCTRLPAHRHSSRCM